MTAMRRYRTNRLEAFSDGVFAVAIIILGIFQPTLAVIGSLLINLFLIPVSELRASIRSEPNG
jgi:uncharacterized membrane protein